MVLFVNKDSDIRCGGENLLDQSSLEATRWLVFGQKHCKRYLSPLLCNFSVQISGLSLTSSSQLVSSSMSLIQGKLYSATPSVISKTLLGPTSFIILRGYSIALMSYITFNFFFQMIPVFWVSKPLPESLSAEIWDSQTDVKTQKLRLRFFVDFSH